MENMIHIGLDVGSTTIKVAVFDKHNSVLETIYRRHFSDIKGQTKTLLEYLLKTYGTTDATLCVTGSSGLFVSERLNIPFVQEVVACTQAIEERMDVVDVAIELGGEDAKITYFGPNIEQRMNGICAGGTGAFIDQMASLLNTDALGLNQLAESATVIYPIASRCGVFAKTDIQPLLNEGTPKSDIALSIFQAVVNQTIAGLACGKPIKGKVIFLGGPLHFLSCLRDRFIKSLKLTDRESICPEDGHFYVAYGAAYASKKEEVRPLGEWLKQLERLMNEEIRESESLQALFKDEATYQAFLNRHEQSTLPKIELSKYQGRIYMGVDAGSTTTKIVAIGENNELLFTHYGSNQGNPLHSTIEALKHFYQEKPENAFVSKAAVTGYGEHLLKAAFHIDLGEIETVAHFKGASFFLPSVDFVLDIGGQDMKSLRVKNGFIEEIMLNEACSSGCGSFIETFAKSLQMDVKSFSKEALLASNPVDLGTRCTVFMNSRVKQSQKEGASVGDISAGIAYSVIKNALYKVIRLKSTKELGEKIVVQGGTFYNDAVLRAFEIITGTEVVRPDIAGVMGAFGAALLAKEREDNQGSRLISYEDLECFEVKIKTTRCHHCGNQCMLTVNQFANGGHFISGNRCEKGAGAYEKHKDIPNVYDYKLGRVFAYASLDEENAPNGTIGIPRVLNIYEHYPFWHTLFTKLGYRVVLSEPSSKALFERGMDSIPSESVCYPAKLAHGHIESLIDSGIKRIFYPSIPYEIEEDYGANNHFNCPIVTSYPENIRCNNERLSQHDIQFINPFLPLYNKQAMLKITKRTFKEFGLEINGIEAALQSAYAALEAYKSDVKLAGERALAYIETTGSKGILLAGRPYHVDPEVNHGIPEMIAGYGMVVLSEDSIAHLSALERPLRVVDQWTYHTRLYRSADVVSRLERVELVQLNSFGCGLDAVTSDQVQEILSARGKSFTLLKIDEINNLGAARIRLRSLMAVMKSKERSQIKNNPTGVSYRHNHAIFTKEMKKTHTILCPQMSPIHFQFIEKAFELSGYNLVVLSETTDKTADEGLKVVNNDACYPSILVVGQLIEALKSGKYDLDNTSVIISQTGGGCRATNYIGFIRKAFKDAGFEQIPVISFNAGGIEKTPGFTLTPILVKRLCMGMLYGDLLMRVVHRTRPYEVNVGEVNQLAQHWSAVCEKSLKNPYYVTFIKNIKGIVQAFDTVPLSMINKPKVGIVGEILVKFHPGGNNHLVDYLEKEGCEVVIPDLADFLLYCSYNTTIRYNMLSASYMKKLGGDLAIGYIEFYRNEMKRVLKKSKRFVPPKSIHELAKGASRVISLGHQTGEGWFLTAEIVELLESNVNNIACLQPFACLPNHITGKGVIKELRNYFPGANIAPIDFDPGASEVNQINRIKLMLSNAFKEIKEKI